MRARTKAAAAGVLLILATTACSRSGGGGGGGASPGAALSSLTSPSTNGAAPTTETAGAAGPPSTAPPDATPAGGSVCSTPPARRQPDPNRPRYSMSLDVQPQAATVSGSIDVRFTPDFETDRVSFRLWANGPRQLGFGDRLDIVGPVEVDGRQVPTSNDDPTILVARPAAAIHAGQAVQARLRFQLRLARPARDRISAESDSVRLGSFFPALEWEPGKGWTTDPPTTRFAEASTTPAADFDLSITTPPGYDVISSGVPDRPGHWTVTAMRDVSVAVGHFTTASGVAHVPDPVQVTVGVDASVSDSPRSYLDRAIAVLEADSKRFGPYPWPTFFVSVTPGISTGIEYPGHILHGPGTANDILTHEVGHQWFYSLVGNNQARDPWLDEALTTWAEARYEDTVGDYQATAVPADVKGRTTEPMTFWDQSANFFLGAYVQGMQALAALGPPDQVDCALRLYAARNAYRIANAADLFASLTVVFPDAPATMARFGIRP